MAHTNYPTPNTLPPNHPSTCDRCGKTSDLVQRLHAFEKSVRDPDGMAQADQMAAQAVQQEATLPYRVHYRCPECGCYSPQAVREMKAAFANHWLNRTLLVCCLVCAGTVALLMAVWIYALDPRWLRGGGWSGLPSALVGLALILLWLAWRSLPMPRAVFEHKIDDANSPEMAEKWLRDWKSGYPALKQKMDRLKPKQPTQPPASSTRPLADPSFTAREQTWNDIYNLQHKYDPLPERTLRGNILSNQVTDSFLPCPQCGEPLKRGKPVFGPPQVRCAHCAETVATGLPAWSDLSFGKKALAALQAIFAPTWLALQEVSSSALLPYQARAAGVLMNLLYFFILAASLSLIPQQLHNRPWLSLILAALLPLALGWLVFLIVLFFRQTAEARRYARDQHPPVWDGGL